MNLEKIAVLLTLLILVSITLMPITNEQETITITMEEPPDTHPTEKVIETSIKRLPVKIEKIDI